MTLTSDNIRTIIQFADKLEKWANNLSYITSPTENLWMKLALTCYPQDFQFTVSWLADIPAVGKEVQKDFEELSAMVQKVDAWHMHGVYEEELREFCALLDRLKDLAFHIVSTLRKIPEAGESKPPPTEAIPAEKSNAPEIQETKPAGMTPDNVAAGLPRKEALMAYKLHYEIGLTQAQVAKKMAGELKLDKPVRRWEVSRWIKQVENWRTRTGLPVESVPEGPATTTVRYAEFEVGTRTDGGKT